MRRNVRQKDVAFLAFLSSFFAPSVYESHLIIGEFSMEKYESPDGPSSAFGSKYSENDRALTDSSGAGRY
ncbi:hypothetical protein O4G76_14920 [Limimaricola sp. G21655-S1]|uniref:hypothetical protein n=1 Tax=Limimaricola sp. G21655-S1 TaxID=3014768 RepID=UPI0022AEF623|nr:hypothetical protein [Limimaricola sp. G21655-S1]MCZ4262136.1 hypothetical protein [Limimaricola sp. G21655-S1]